MDLSDAMPARYQVIGPKAILGRQPGEVFDAAIPYAQAERLLRRNQLAIVAPQPDPQPYQPCEPADAGARQTTPGVPGKEGE